MTGVDPLEELLQTSRWQRGVERRLAERRKATQIGEAFDYNPYAGDPDHDASAWRAYVEGGNDY
jgi:hypothetical protein